MPPPCPHHGEGGGDGPPGGGVQQGKVCLLPPDEVYKQKVFKSNHWKRCIWFKPCISSRFHKLVSHYEWVN